MEQTFSQSGHKPDVLSTHPRTSCIQHWLASALWHWPLLAVLVHFTLLAKRRVRFYFIYDDMMNLYFAWVAPLPQYAAQVVTFWSSQSRPVGGLFYRAVYALGGFDPVVFHVACLAVLLLNLVLAWNLYLALGRSRLLAGYALLAVCFHGDLWEAYWNTAMVYDVLCATFYLSALLVYVRRREAGLSSVWTGVAAALLTILAIGSKELGATVPGVLLAYELLFHPPQRWQDAARWLRQWTLLLGPALLVSLAYVAGRLLLKGPLTGHPAYTPIVSVDHFLSMLAAYTQMLISHRVTLSPATAVLFWLGCLAAAIALRSRLALFGIAFHLIALLPMLFAGERGAYVLYLSLFGSALFVGSVVQRTVMAVARWQAGDASQTATASRPFGVLPRVMLAALVLLTAGVQMAHHRKLVRLGIIPIGPEPVRETAQQIPRLRPHLKPEGRVLLLNSPFLNDIYVGLFTVSLRYGLPRLQVTQEEWNREQGALPASAREYDYVFAYDRDLHRYQDVSADAVTPQPAAYIAMSSPAVEHTVVQGVGVLQAGVWRWTRPSPEFRFAAPPGAQHFEMKYAVPEVILQQTGPLQLSYRINGNLAHQETVRNPGDYQAAVPLPASIQTGDVVNVRVQVHNPYVAGKDQVRLGFQLKAAGLR